MVRLTDIPDESSITTPVLLKGGDPKKVPKACERCRKQKLKCDVQRPCTLCVRADARCTAVEPDIWRAHHPAPRSTGVREKEDDSECARPTKRRRVTPARRESVPATTSERPPSSASPAETPWNSSSAITFVKEAFQRHETTTPVETVSSLNGASRRGQRCKGSSSATMKLLLMLPPLESAKLLVETYFDRVHWFTLVFYQDDFRNKFTDLYNGTSSHPAPNGAQFGFMSLLLAVFVVSLHDLGEEQKRSLVSCGAEPQALQENILTTLRTSFLDIVALGTIEAVQTCTLLGSYYLYRGEPESAWPICGCGLRIAQALNLHRKTPAHDVVNRHAEEIRKRCWWAVYEVETFCSMLYGFPVSISDRDCDVDLMDPHDQYSSCVEGKLPFETTLLSYKSSMLKLSVIVKSALIDLYSTPQGVPKQASSAPENASRLQRLISNVATFDKQLQQWHAGLSIELRWKDSSVLSTQNHLSSETYHSTSPHDTAFEHHLFQVQALILQLAYENAKILVHRPLLSYKMVVPGDSTSVGPSQALDPFQSSIKACREAALKISNLVSSPISKEASNTYALAFICVHLLTAGIALSIMTSLNPLGKDSHECKIGVRNIMKMQTQLKDKSIVAEQGLHVLKKLIELVFKKELDKMLDIEGSTTKAAGDERATVEKDCTTSQSGVGRTSEMAQGKSPNESTMPLTSERVVLDDLRPGDEAEHLTEDETTGDCYFDFCEDTSMTQALLDLGLTMNEGPDDSVTNLGLSALNHVCSTDDYFISQEQGWIWASNP
ncbi:hypothetical protein BU16DRAFT_512908 [Lophium mytilinum]|uniref:Zn(2)-C6 fungal-type domain-containing protein n=1 Tax=Lophium mytilinum TaxID=390894 RepID=A0A6A6QLF1_9PEZI|nr:hypothetical protein BU16DRAFT_512908 [Lophium mytilinum]